MKVFILIDEHAVSERSLSKQLFDYFDIPQGSRAQSIFSADRVIAVEHPCSNNHLRIKVFAGIARMIGKYVSYVKMEDLL